MSWLLGGRTRGCDVASPLCVQKAPVWEITGAEFSKAEAHTADGISIRFPRCTRIRDDKDWQTATNLQQLKVGQHGALQLQTNHSMHSRHLLPVTAPSGFPSCQAWAGLFCWRPPRSLELLWCCALSEKSLRAVGSISSCGRMRNCLPQR